jgi:hypothetical protein
MTLLRLVPDGSKVGETGVIGTVTLIRGAGQEGGLVVIDHVVIQGLPLDLHTPSTPKPEPDNPQPQYIEGWIINV